jgi:hypothetical protein
MIQIVPPWIANALERFAKMWKWLWGERDE